MSATDRAPPRGVPRLLALLAGSVEQATKAAQRGPSWREGAAPAELAVDRATSSSTQQHPADGSTLRIRSLRRVYNTLIFGGPSHDEIVEQAALEDSCCGSWLVNENDGKKRGEITPQGVVGGYPAASASASAAQSDDNCDALASVFASVSVFSLQLRCARRFDPANALEGLVDNLLATHGGEDGALTIALTLRLFAALREEGGQPRDVDDWEIIGGHGRRVLQRLYAGGGGLGSAASICKNGGCTNQQQQQQRQRNPTDGTAAVPAAKFFRSGQGSDALHRPCHIIEAVPSRVVAAASAAGQDAWTAESTTTATAPYAEQQYLLPNDCVLHGDSVAAMYFSSSSASAQSRGSAGLGLERIPWFTDTEFSSGRSIPDMSEPSSLSRYLQATASAPLAPTAWTSLLQDGGEKKMVPSFANGYSGGARALPVVAGEGAKDSPHLADVGGHGRVGACALDLFGALSRARLDARSPGVRELRVELSFPNLLDDRSTDLLAEAQQRLSGSASADPAKGRGNGGGGGGRGHYVTPGSPRQQGFPARARMAPPGSAAQDRANKPGLSRRPGSLSPEAVAPPRRRTSDHGQRADYTVHDVATLELDSVGWEQTEAGWNDPSVPKWALASAPLATAEGGPGSGAFEVCYREHFGGGATGLEEEVPVTAEADVVHRSLAVLQGVPSEIFWYDKKQACMRVSGCVEDEKARLGVEEVALTPRVVGLSPGALSSLLGEFANAGTWFRRVEEFATRLLDRSVAAGQVAQAFGIELRRQLTVLQSEILGVTAEISGLGCNATEGAFIDSSMHERRDEAGCELPPPSAKCCSLMGVLVRTTALRRAEEALAEVCGLASKELNAVEGVRTVTEAFPRGASLLTYLYNAAEVRAASKPGGVEESTGMGGVMGGKDSVLALLSCAAAPYLMMLGRWLWSGEMLAEDDPYEEFPLRCREALAGASGSSEDGPKGKEPWMEDGGGSFMTLAFHENESAGVPCFLDGGVLAAAARAGKLLRMLKLSSPEFYATCAVFPPPPLSLLFGTCALASRVAVFTRLSLLRAVSGRSAAREVRARATEIEMRKGMEGRTRSERQLVEEKSAFGKFELQRARDRASVDEARRIWMQGLKGDRAAEPDAAAAAAAAASAVSASPSASTADQASSVAALSGRGILSFLVPPTSEAEAFAAAALRERYRLLGEEADARAARARWKRQRNERVVAARASLNMLYAKEASAWKVMAAEAAGGCGEVAANGGVDGAISTAAVADGDGDGGSVGYDTDEAAVEGRGTVLGDREGGVEIGVEEVEDGGVRGGLTVPGSAAPPLPAQSPPSRRSSEDISLGETDVAIARGTRLEERPSGHGGAVTVKEQAASTTMERDGSLGDRHRDDAKFSPVTIVQEPGGKSTGVSAALGKRAGETLRDRPVPSDDPPLKFSHVKIVQEPGGKSDGVSRALGAGADSGGDAMVPSAHGTGIGTTQELHDNASSIPRLSSSASLQHVAGVVDGTVRRLGDTVLGEADGSDNLESRLREIQVSDKDFASVLHPVETMGPGGDDVGSHSGEPLQHGQSSRKSSVDVAEEISAARVETEGSEDAGEPKAAVGRIIEFARPTAESHASPTAGHRETSSAQSAGLDFGAALDRKSAGGSTSGTFLPEHKLRMDAADGKESDSRLPFDVIVRRCVREPVFAQCRAIDSAALVYLVRDAGVAEHLASMRMFLLGLGSNFLHDFTLRLLDGLYDGGVEWRQSSNLDAAFAASASAAGLDSLPLALGMFRYEVDPTCGGILGGSVAGGEDGGLRCTVPSALGTHRELYSPAALSFVSPVVEVPWPVGVLLPTGVLRTYSSIHRSLFRHQLVLHRLRRLRVAFRELDAAINAWGGGRRSGGRGGGSDDGAGVSWDAGRLHWMHLFRHEMQHMADSLQAFFAEQAETGWPDLRKSLAVTDGQGSFPRTAWSGGGLAVLVAAHSSYISNMHSHMFLGTDRQGIVARARIEEFYEVVSTVGRVTDSLLPAPSQTPDARSGREGVPRTRSRGNGQGMVLPDGAFEELVDARGRFDTARRGLCGALLDISAAGGSARARPFLAILGYGGYGGDSIA